MEESPRAFRVGDRVRFSAVGLKCNQRTNHTTGTVTGLMRTGIRIKRDGLKKEQTWPSHLWDLIPKHQAELAEAQVSREESEAV